MSFGAHHQAPVIDAGEDDDSLQMEVSSSDNHGLGKHLQSQGNPEVEDLELIVIGAHSEPEILLVYLLNVQYVSQRVKVVIHI